MRVSEQILDKIKRDRVFRFGVAMALGISERQVYNLIKNNSDNLTKYKAVEYYLSQGFSESEIFEKEKLKNR